MTQLMAWAFGGGLAGVFGSRAFLPAFALAVALRLGWGGAVVESATGLGAAGVPAWFTSDACLIVLGVLAALEVAATKVPELRELFDAAGPYVKPAMAALTVVGVLGAGDGAFLEDAVGDKLDRAGVFGPFAAASGWFLAGLVGIGTWGVTVARSAALSLARDADEDDATGLQGLLAWAEDVWATVGPVLLLLFPFVMLGVVAAVTGSLVWMRRRAQASEDARRAACATCGHSVYACAVACPNCRTPRASPRSVGFLGTATGRAARDLANHPYRLVAKKRCPVCAERFADRAVRQRCDACGHRLMADPAFADGYLAHVAGRVPSTLAVTAAMALVPVVGLVAGVIYYRMVLVAPFRRYLPPGRALGTRLGLRVLFVALAVVQVVPIVGGAVVPAMALVNYAAYRRAWVAEGSRADRSDAPIGAALAT